MSFIHPLTILSTLPYAGVGALLALRAAGMDLSVIGIIGIIPLIGIVKKNGIMLVDFAITAERNERMTPLEAIREACLLRFRPILMTTAAAMLAGVPLALGSGPGSELCQPLGYAMVDGLALSQLLTLYTTPVVYLYLGRLQAWLTRSTRDDDKPRFGGSPPNDASFQARREALTGSWFDERSLLAGWRDRRRKTMPAPWHAT